MKGNLPDTDYKGCTRGPLFCHNQQLSPHHHGSMRKLVTILILSCFVSGCVMVPKVDTSHAPQCELVTKKLTVTTKTAGIDHILNDDRPNQDPRAVVVILTGTGIVYSVSAIVSGSIMIAGNTIHWIEQEGTCEDGMVASAISSLSGSMKSIGGSGRYSQLAAAHQ